MLARARAALAGGRPAAALSELEALPGAHPEALQMRAAALAELGKVRIAMDLLQAQLARDPEDPMTLFNLALLERDYNRDVAASVPLLRAFLVAAATRGADPLRLAQAEFWLNDAEKVQP